MDSTVLLFALACSTVPASVDDTAAPDAVIEVDTGFSPNGNAPYHPAPPQALPGFWSVNERSAYATAHSELFLTDLNQDGAVDLILGGDDQMALTWGPIDRNESPGSDLSMSAPFAGSWWGHPQAKDVDGDGTLEILGLDPNQDSWTGAVALLDPVEGTFTEWTGTQQGEDTITYLGWDGAFVGDQNGDGIEDLMVSQWDKHAFLLSSDAPSGPISEHAHTVLSTNKTGGRLAAADLDGDGTLDLVIENAIFLGPVDGPRAPEDADALLPGKRAFAVEHPGGDPAEIWLESEGLARVERPLSSDGVLDAHWAVERTESFAEGYSLGDLDGDGRSELQFGGTDNAYQSFTTFVVHTRAGTYDAEASALLELPDITHLQTLATPENPQQLVGMRDARERGVDPETGDPSLIFFDYTVAD